MAAMKALAWLESVLQELVERPQWLLTPNHIHPLAIAAAITRALESQTLPLGDRVVAPNEFTVHLQSDDFEQIATVRRTLERELGMYVARAADERHLTLPARPLVGFVADDSVRPGAVEVVSAFGEAPAPPAPPTRIASLAGFTERIAPGALGPYAPPGGHAGLELLGDDGGVARVFALDAPIITIGRRAGNEVALLDLEVSRQHARIDFVSPRYFLTDLGSTNGTWLNGQPVRGRQLLHDGDLIELGRQRLRFREG